MEPDVIRMYSSSPPPMEDAAEDEDSDFGDFGTFAGVPNSISFTEFDTPTTFNQTQALNATSPPELVNARAGMGFSSSNGTHCPGNELSKANGVLPAAHLDSSPSERTEMKKVLCSSLELSVSNSARGEPTDCNGGCTEVLTNGFASLDVQGSPSPLNSVHSHIKGSSIGDNGSIAPDSPEDDFADFAAFSDAEGQTANEDGSSGQRASELSIHSGGCGPAEDACLELCSPSAQGTTAEDGDTIRTTTGSPESSPVPAKTSHRAAHPDSLHQAAHTDSLQRDVHTDSLHQAVHTDSLHQAVHPDSLHQAVHTDSLHQAVHTDSLHQAVHTDSLHQAVHTDSLHQAVHTDSLHQAVHTDSLQRDVHTDPLQREVALASEAVCTLAALNGRHVAHTDDPKDTCDLSPEGAENWKGNDTETETETETSLGRPLSTDALEEYADMSTTGSVPSPPLHGETATPADHSQLADDMDEDFGDFGDAGSFGGQGFVEFDQQEQSRPHSPAPADTNKDANENANEDAKEDDDFGDFNSPKFHVGGGEPEDAGKFADFPVSDSFGNFSAADGGPDVGWSAFGEQQQQVEAESWAAFSTEPSCAPPADIREEEELEEEEEEWHEGEAPAVSEEDSRTDRQAASLSVRLERLFQSSFPQAAAPMMEGVQVSTLLNLLEPSEETPGAEEETGRRSVRGGSVWTQLQDIHEAIGLRYQWGGSHCNKALLCCLGIDTRNILFTGQRKQPVIVPMYAASLGMLEPTKEPVKPVSAAEMIASIAQAPAAAPEKSSCTPDPVQEALPPVQFDWSSSGLTNPLDGVDPELYELTTAKLDPGSSGRRVADAFARLMSTMEKTSTSTRKPRREENLSEEAAKVISSLPDLSFMQAKVLMFPATLTPLGSAATAD